MGILGKKYGVVIFDNEGYCYGEPMIIEIKIIRSKH